jgi:uncharacterized protein
MRFGIAHKEEPPMRRDMAFQSKGITCRGWFYVPDGLGQGQKAPTIVMAHGFSAVKEMYLQHFAERFAANGLACLVFDYRYLGASDGEPRGQIFPWEQIEDYRNAMTFASELPEVDAERIGIWGSSYSGGHVLCVGALDRRVRCVVSQVPLIDGWKDLTRLVTCENIPLLHQVLLQDRLVRTKTGAVQYLPVVAEDANCALIHREAYTWFTETARTIAPAWHNQVTVESLEHFIAYSPEVFLPRISPTPLLLVVASHDTIAPTDIALEGYERALEPKRLVIMQGGHFDAYSGPGFDITSGAAVEWFKQHLG